MTESTAPATNAAANKAAKAAAASAAAVSDTLPTVVSTTELAMEVPTKVVLNQRLIVVASVVGGVAVGAGALYGLQKLKARRDVAKLNRQIHVPVPTDENA